MASTQPLPDIPEIGISFPPSVIARQAFSFAKQHCSPTVYNHMARSAYWALLLSKKLPGFDDPSRVDLELVSISCLLHDMGWASTKSLLSTDKRFEVDGANIARDFVSQGSINWEATKVQGLWDAIAFHTTASIAKYAAPNVALTHLGIMADFVGPKFLTGDVITLKEYRALIAIFPREEFDGEGLKGIICGLCRDKPTTTYDNFTAIFGLKYGLDGEGQDKDQYAAAWKENQFAERAVQGLDSLATLDKGDWQE